MNFFVYIFWWHIYFILLDKIIKKKMQKKKMQKEIHGDFIKDLFKQELKTMKYSNYNYYVPTEEYKKLSDENKNLLLVKEITTGDSIFRISYYKKENEKINKE